MSFQVTVVSNNILDESMEVPLLSLLLNASLNKYLQSRTKYLEESDAFADYLCSYHLHIPATPFYPHNNVGWHLEAEKRPNKLVSG